ncbi:glycine/sarcosine/betaine reductase component B subunit [uncultured Megasphaera sp.]|uniref:glycine/sarcosine/betaine reductase component B subunit n=1 Tax=uncultured Megasphaera sp. TaxID=165188 RepID=UPI00265AA50B|nr:glycine/sarcosine/betaine reductase component B subunit [uncultured Megasphaera sp.]
MGIGPSTKETSKHYFEDPLVKAFAGDPDIDFCGVIVVGTPQDNRMKHLVGQRTAAWLKAMACDGAVISADGWGNSDVDFMNTMEQIGQRNISIVGLKFIGKQANFVVANEYTQQVLDINKSAEGIETEVVGENAIAHIDAVKALAAIKLVMRKDKK